MPRKRTGKTAPQIRETDLDAPVRDFLVSNGYTVRSEVLGCDMTASKKNELIIIELKRSPNIKLLIQATDRLKYTTSVYVAIVEPVRKSRHYRGVMRILKALKLGLITVRFSKLGPRVKIVFDPPLPDSVQGSLKAGKHSQALLTELNGRSGDYNVGGSNRTRLITAYREKAIFIACCLDRFGPLSTRRLRDLGAGEKARSIVANNHYHWFRRKSRGVYEINERGICELDEYHDIVKNSHQEIDRVMEHEKCQYGADVALADTN